MAWSFYHILPITARPRSWSQDFQQNHTQPPAPLLSSSRNGSGLNQPPWCSGHICGTAKASVLCLKYKTKIPNSQAGPCNACVQVSVCTPQPHIRKNANTQSEGWSLLKVQTVCSKLHFEGQIHNTTGQPTSKNTFCDFRLRCSEDFGEKVFLLYLLFHISELTSLGCMFADKKSPFGNSTCQELYQGRAPLTRLLGATAALQPLQRQNKKAQQEELVESLDAAKLNFLCFIPASITDF